MKAIVIDYNTYLSITKALAQLDVVDVIWGENSFTVWYN